MKLNDKWIEAAITALTAEGIVKNGEYDKEFKGYISSFGAAVIQSGLLPAVMFYENNGGSDADRTLLVKVIVNVLKQVTGGKKHVADYSLNVHPKFSLYLIDNKDDIKNMTLDVNHAATCLKLALRLYKEKGSNPKTQENEL